MKPEPTPVSEEKVAWYSSSVMMIVLFWTLGILTIGILPAVCFFYPVLGLQLTSSVCDADDAEYAVVSVEGKDYVANCSHHDSSLTTEHLVIIEANCQRYFASSHDHFMLSKISEVPTNFIELLKSKRGRCDVKTLVEENSSIRAEYGPNALKIPETNGFVIFIRSALSPFFLFQYFAVTVWFIEDYDYYAGLILLITLAAVIITTQESIFNLERLRALAGVESKVMLLDGLIGANPIFTDNNSISVQKATHEVSSTVLIPGDRFVVTPGQSLPCDAILISGRIVVDESMLTGESLPVSKFAVEDSDLDNGVDTFVMARGHSTPGSHSTPIQGSTSYGSGDVRKGSTAVKEPIDFANKRTGNVLFGGTVVKACHGHNCVAVCYRTGFRSAKGQLISTLLSPKECFMTFISDAIYVMLCMVLLTTCLYAYCAYELYYMDATMGSILFRYLDAITIAVPPALTACLTVATAIAIGRLKERNIFVSETSRVNWGGTISFACFDKTGTLTDQRLEFQGASISIVDPLDSSQMRFRKYTDVKDFASVAVELMASCHSLSLLGDAADYSPTGDPLEVELLRACGWKISVEAEDTGKMVVYPRGHVLDRAYRHEILRHFEFTPDKLRAATLLRRPTGEIVYLIKGSPEAIIALSDQNSLPVDLQDTLTYTAKQGLRIIAMAYRDCPESLAELMSYTQDDIEALGRPDHLFASPSKRKNQIKFAGLLYLSSALKDSAASTVVTLARANIPSNMITGDHIHTAIAVATSCGIIATPTRTNNPLYIVDENVSDGSVVIRESATDSDARMSLTELLDLAASTQQPRNSSNRSLVPVASIISSRKISGKVQIAVTGSGLQAVARACAEEDVRESEGDCCSQDSTLSSLVRYARVFARTKPADKKYIVEQLMRTCEVDTRPYFMRASCSQIVKSESARSPVDATTQDSIAERGNFAVVYVGDGANDMAALRAATVGLSLCDAETSVAAPVTSKMQTPGSVIEVIQEGRCSLITAYVLVMFNVMYGIIQLFMCIELYRYGLVAGNYMYLTQDLVFTLVLGLSIAYTPPSDCLSVDIPSKRFLTKHLITKLGLQVLCFMGFQMLSLMVLSMQSFYTRYETDDPLVSTYSYEATTVDTMALAQLMIASMASTMGEPFRKPWYHNKFHIFALTYQSAWVLFQLFGADNYFGEVFLDLKPLPFGFAVLLLCLMLLNGVTSLALSVLADCLLVHRDEVCEEDLPAVFKSLQSSSSSSSNTNNNMINNSSTASAGVSSNTKPVVLNISTARSPYESFGTSSDNRYLQRSLSQQGQDKERDSDTDKLSLGDDII